MGKGKKILEQYFPGEKNEKCNLFKVLLSPFTYGDGSRQTARNTGMVRNKIMMIVILEELPY